MKFFSNLNHICALLHLFPCPGLLPDLSALAFFCCCFYITSLLKPLLTQPASCSLTFINRTADSAHVCGRHVLFSVWVQRVLHCRGSHHNPPCRCIKSEQCLPHLSDRTEKTQRCKNTDSPLCVEKKQLPLKSLFFYSLLYKWDVVNIVWTRIKGLYI